MFLGIDFGTSGCRAVVIDRSRQIHAEEKWPLPEPVHHAGSVKQDAALWTEALTQLLQQLGHKTDLQKIQRLALNATSGSALLVDPSGIPLTPARMYNDSSGLHQVEQIARACDCAQHITLSAGSTLARVLQLIDDHAAEDRFVIAHQADYLNTWLTGCNAVSDYHNSLKLGFDPESLIWPGWIEQLLPANSLPRVLEPGALIGAIARPIAERFGFDPSLEVRAGTTDANAAFIATSLNQPGDAVTSLGSTLVLKLLGKQRVDLPAQGVYSHRLGKLWLTGGASNAGSAVLRDYFSDQQLAELTPQMDINQPTGLDYYPMKGRGERFPDPNPNQRPRLEPRPDSDARFVQAILEALSRIEHRGYQLLASAGAPGLTRVHTMGGGAANPLWNALREQTLGVPVVPADHTEAAFGSALLAMQGLKSYA